MMESGEDINIDGGDVVPVREKSTKEDGEEEREIGDNL